MPVVHKSLLALLFFASFSVHAELNSNKDLSFAPTNSKFKEGGDRQNGVNGAYTHHFTRYVGVTAGSTIYDFSSNDERDLLIWGLYSGLNLKAPNSSPFTPHLQVGLQGWYTRYEGKGPYDDSVSDNGIDAFLAAGIDLRLNPRLNLFLNYRRSRFGFDDGDLNLNSAMLGLRIKLGGSSKPKRSQSYVEPQNYSQESSPSNNTSSKPHTTTEKKPSSRKSNDSDTPGAIRKSKACDPRYKDLFSSC